MSTTRFSGFRAAIAAIGVALLVVGTVTAGPISRAEAAGEPGVAHVPIQGGGSTWSANALQQWIRNVWSNQQWKITYDESGSTQGRNGFANGTLDFGVSEIPYAIANSQEADRQPPRGFAYMPIVAGGTAFMYNLQIGGKRVTNLRLSGETVAKIFTGVIVQWDDPAIKADNPGLALPGVPIVPVVRSDGSGATAQVSIWLREQYPAIWDAYCVQVNRPLINGHCGVTSNFPIVPSSRFVAKAGSNGVAGYVAQSAAVGAITFVEYSYALSSGFPVAKLLNSAGYYTEPTAANVAVALLQAQINEDQSSTNYLTQDLRNVYTSGDPRSYALSSYSYIILPTKEEAGFTRDKGLTLADFGAYFLCEGQNQAETLGYSPLPINLVLAGQSQIQKIPGGNPAITGPENCNNPTFSPDGTNKLTATASYPQECDRQGPAQCVTGTGGAKGEVTPNTGGASGAGGAGVSTGTAGAGGSAGAGQSAAAATDAVGAAGSAASLGGDAAAVSDTAEAVLVNATPQTIAQAGLGLTGAFITAASGLVLLAFAALPPLLSRRRSRAGLLPYASALNPRKTR